MINVVKQKSNDNKLRITKVWILFLLFMVLINLVCLCTQAKVTKVLKVAEVPQKILEEVKNMPLETGYYFFEASYAGKAILLLCGEKDQPFDIEIDNVEYVKLNENKYRLYIELSKVDKLRTIDTQEYSLPVVFLAIDNRTELISEVSCDSLKFKGWRSTELANTSDSRVDVQIIQQEAEIPEEIWNYMIEHDLDRGVYEILSENSKLDTQYYIISGGDFNPQYCNAKIYAFDVLMRNLTYECVEFGLGIHFLTSTSDSISYSQTLNKPYVVFSVIDNEGMDVESQTINGPTVLDIKGSMQKEVLIIE
ncbi:hypothetical protein IMX26_08660 [Clostridium sp. 'deep sea']|uniref:hypothetical protein n=1 Tax=Clostridium sp. 'deep sea' TaxID=2779445 RepID=UPI0018969BEB|nr:hypothetical protein [Clostridium sp. 'deep sea']QOR36862.1 hypothetical protein IMX26_08660 [Clostridium sp. 'deep sea']